MYGGMRYAKQACGEFLMITKPSQQVLRTTHMPVHQKLISYIVTAKKLHLC